MKEESNTRKLKNAINKISRESVLTMSEAFEIIRDGMVFPELLDIVSDRIIELANKGETIPIIKIEVYSMMTHVGVAGSVENYLSIRELTGKVKCRSMGKGSGSDKVNNAWNVTDDG